MSTNGTNKTTITCPHCNQVFSAAPPRPEQPLNTLRVSMAVAPHEKPIRCPNAKCAKYFVWGVNAIEFSWVVIPISEQDAASLIDKPNLIIAPPPLSLIH